ncbi:MAG: hypothetical protein K9N34_09295 [Candidatus Marinimicrobia bacterium]|nr:hypothetical protein [Candidatus Neomarinimicrobiota bacterium]MCF7839973.1 hypothetical protein [Candidatus Neomarinimicrobiota bacterium]
MSGFSHTLNVHPMFVHFPIVLMLLALLLQTLAFWRESDFFNKAAVFTFDLLVISAIVTLFTGYRAADSLGHETPGHDFVHYHRNLMVIFTVAGAALAILFHSIKSFNHPIMRWIAFLVLSGWLVYSADKGAELVYRYGIGVKLEVPLEPDEPHHPEKPENNGNVHQHDHHETNEIH